MGGSLSHMPLEDDLELGLPFVLVGSGGANFQKKATVVQPWIQLDSTGQSKVEEDGKHAIMRQTGLPARDLRMLDPLLSYPSTVLCRERAVLINLEHIKAIITAQEVLLLNSPFVFPLVEELQRRLMRHHRATRFQDENEDGKGEKQDGCQNHVGLKVLPFEFVALEACLEAACTCLKNEARALELEAHLALDKLTSNNSTVNLEYVRQIKSRLVAVTGRAQKVRDELKRLLDDDKDMAEMYLTEKLVQQQLDNSSSSMYERDDKDGKVFRSDVDDSVPSHVNYSAMGKEFDVKDIEMLLEACLGQIDGTLNQLSMLREYIDDKKDYSKLRSDDKKNLLQLIEVILGIAALILTAFAAVASVFGMNVKIELFDDKKDGMPVFFWIVCGSIAGGILLFIAAIAWLKHKDLLEL